MYPPGIVTRTCTVGGATAQESGDPLILSVVVASSRGLIWASTGWRLPSLPRTVASTVGSEATFELPVTSQAGFRSDSSPGTIIDVSAPGSYSHTYTATVTITTPTGGLVSQHVIGPFPLPAEDLSPVDLDTMLPVGTVAGGAVLVPDSWDAKIAAAEAVTSGFGATGTAIAATSTPAAARAALGIGPASMQMSAIKSALAVGEPSVAIQILGDSTGNETTEWPHLFASDLAAAYPAWTVQNRTWDDANSRYAAPVTIQTGAAGERYLDCDPAKVHRGAASVHLAGVIDVRVKLMATDWTPTVSRMIVGQMSQPGERSWCLSIHTSGVLLFSYSTDGNTTVNMFGGGGPTVADGAATWVRGVFTPDDGAGNRTFKAYQSADGLTWTQTGATTTTAGAVALFDASSTEPYYGFGLGGNTVGSFQRWAGRIYEVGIRDGLDGPPVAPILPDLWGVRVEGVTPSSPVVGAPVLTLVNGSIPGASIGTLGDPARLAKMTPDYGQALTILSDCHNERTYIGRTWLARYKAWAEQVRSIIVGTPVVAVTQNPQFVTNGYAIPHAQRRTSLVAYGTQPGAPFAVLDTYQAFLDAGDWAATLMGDSIHPNAAGSRLWADVVTGAFNSA